MITVYCCDDNALDLKLLSEALSIYKKDKRTDLTVRQFTNPQALLYEVEDAKIPEIFILDIEMPEMDGFQLAEKLRAHTSTAIILFLTSHDEFAAKGYKSKALRYINKLHLEKELYEAMDAALEELSVADEKTVQLHHYGDHWRMPYSEIVCVERIGRQLVITAASGEQITDPRGISDFFSDLHDARFLFIDRGCFVNLNYISRLSGFQLTLKTGKILTVSRRNLQNVKQTILEQWGMKQQ